LRAEIDFGEMFLAFEVPTISVVARELENKKPDVYMFPNADGGFILKDNYLHRVLYPLPDRKDEEGKQSGAYGAYRR
jgi:hypothetical protein